MCLQARYLIERYDGKGTPGNVLDELAAVLQIHKYGSNSKHKSEEARKIRNEISDCTDGMMVYVVMRHDKKAQRDMSAQERDGSNSCVISDGQNGDTGAIEMRDINSSVNHTHVNHMPSEVGIRKRRSRRPTTSTLSDKVWREMRKQITGRAQDDGVT